MGIVAYLLKAGVMQMEMNQYFLLSVMASPFMWFLAVLSIAAFLIMQKALHGSHVSIVSPMVGGISIVLPVIMAWLWLGESVSPLKWAGIILVLVGTVGLGK